MLRRTCAVSPLGWPVYRRFPGNRHPLVGYCLPHTSLIVPWAAPWCQLPPAPCLHETRGRGCRKSEQLWEEAATVRGREEAIILGGGLLDSAAGSRTALKEKKICRKI